jgi:prefoldin subunit 5
MTAIQQRLADLIAQVQTIQAALVALHDQITQLQAIKTQLRADIERIGNTAAVNANAKYGVSLEISAATEEANILQAEVNTLAAEVGE